MANGVLLRGFSKNPDIPRFPEKYRMDSLAITTYPMYRGIAKVLGMKVEKEPADYKEMVSILKEHYDRYQFFFLHVKETDIAGEDGNFKEKTRAIEFVDTIVPDIYGLKPKSARRHRRPFDPLSPERPQLAPRAAFDCRGYG